MGERPKATEAALGNTYYVSVAQDDDLPLQDLIDTGACLAPLPIPPCSIRSAFKLAAYYGNGTVDIPSDDYGVSTPLTISGPIMVTIMGHGSGSTIISGNGVTRVIDISHPNAVVIIEDLQIKDGFSPGVGGGIATVGNLTLNRVVLYNNTANNSGGGVVIWGAAGKTLIIRDSTIEQNSAGISGGGISVYDPSDYLIMSGTSVLSNLAYSDAGGLDLVGGASISNSTIAYNKGPRGGGFRALSSFTLTDSTVLANESTTHGGGIAVFSSCCSIVQADIKRSLIADNIDHGTQGGGISQRSGTILLVENSTITGNQTSATGGGLYTEGQATLRSVTMTNNLGTNGAGIYRNSLAGASVVLDNSILWGNLSGGNPSDCFNGISGQGYNIVGPPVGCTISGGFVLNVDPLISPLADNGGLSETQLPAFNSPAIDGGLLCVGGEDQRALPRADLACDIGAVEVQLSDTDTIQKCNLAEGSSYSFGPTLFKLMVTTAGTLSCITVQMLPGDYPGAPMIISSSSDLSWDITAIGAGFNLDVGFPAETVIGTPQYICRSDGGSWTCTADSDPDPNRIGRNGVQAFSAWQGCGGMPCDSPTAITLLGMKTSANQFLTWKMFGLFLLILALGAGSLRALGTHNRRIEKISG